MNKTFAWQNAPEADFAVLAQDASHSLSPQMHTRAFQTVGLTYRYVALNVAPGEVGQALDYLKERGYIGVNLTMPHKIEGLSWLQTFANPDFPEVRAVNTILLSDRAGFNTDVSGLLRCFDALDLGSGARCLVLGAGGSAMAAVAVLVQLGMEVRIWSRTQVRAQELVNQMQLPVQVAPSASWEECRLVVNATSAGKSGQTPPVDWNFLDRHCIAYDLYYSPGNTPFLREALAKRLRSIDGVDLLVYQGADAWKCWGIDARPPIALMKRTVREYLNADQ